jgi:hypothetical protein
MRRGISSEGSCRGRVKQVAERALPVGVGQGGARPLDRAGIDSPHAFDFARTMTREHRGVGVAAADFSTSIHRFVIVARRAAS